MDGAGPVEWIIQRNIKKLLGKIWRYSWYEKFHVLTQETNFFWRLMAMRLIDQIVKTANSKLDVILGCKDRAHKVSLTWMDDIFGKKMEI